MSAAGSPRALGAVVALLLVFAIGSIVALAVLVATLAEDEERPQPAPAPSPPSPRATTAVSSGHRTSPTAGGRWWRRPPGRPDSR